MGEPIRRSGELESLLSPYKQLLAAWAPWTSQPNEFEAVRDSVGPVGRRRGHILDAMRARACLLPWFRPAVRVLESFPLTSSSSIHNPELQAARCAEMTCASAAVERFAVHRILFSDSTFERLNQAGGSQASVLHLTWAEQDGSSTEQLVLVLCFPGECVSGVRGARMVTTHTAAFEWAHTLPVLFPGLLSVWVPFRAASPGYKDDFGPRGEALPVGLETALALPPLAAFAGLLEQGEAVAIGSAHKNKCHFTDRRQGLLLAVFFGNLP